MQESRMVLLEAMIGSTFQQLVDRKSDHHYLMVSKNDESPASAELSISPKRKIS